MTTTLLVDGCSCCTSLAPLAFTRRLTVFHFTEADYAIDIRLARCDSNRHPALTSVSTGATLSLFATSAFIIQSQQSFHLHYVCLNANSGSSCGEKGSHIQTP